MTCADSKRFVILALFSGTKVKSLGIKNKHTGSRGEKNVLAEVRYVKGTSSLQIKPLDIKNRSIYFKNNSMWY